MARIYKLSKRDGVLGYRPVGNEVELSPEGVLRIDSIGYVAADDPEAELYQWTYDNGRKIVASVMFPLDNNFDYAVRIDHPELGRIWYVDEAKTNVEIASRAIMWQEDDIKVPVYKGIDGSIDDLNPPNGRKYQTLVGPSIVIASIPA